MKRKLIKIADKIITLEEKIERGENVVENMEAIEKIASSLSTEEMLEIDSYIMTHLKN